MICNGVCSGVFYGDISRKYGISAEHKNCISKCIQALSTECLETLVYDAIKNCYVDTINYLLKNKIREYIVLDDPMDIFGCIHQCISGDIIPVVLCYIIRYLTVKEKDYMLATHDLRIHHFISGIVISKKVSVKTFAKAMSRVKINRQIYNIVVDDLKNNAFDNTEPASIDVIEKLRILNPSG